MLYPTSNMYMNTTEEKQFTKTPLGLFLYQITSCPLTSQDQSLLTNSKINQPAQTNLVKTTPHPPPPLYQPSTIALHGHIRRAFNYDRFSIGIIIRSFSRYSTFIESNRYISIFRSRYGSAILLKKYLHVDCGHWGSNTFRLVEKAILKTLLP